MSVAFVAPFAGCPSRRACVRRANGTRFSRREASAASEAVGWKRMLGGMVNNYEFTAKR